MIFSFHLSVKCKLSDCVSAAVLFSSVSCVASFEDLEYGVE